MGTIASKSETKSEAYDQLNIANAADTMLRSEEIKNNRKLFRLAPKELIKRKAAINALVKDKN